WQRLLQKSCSGEYGNSKDLKTSTYLCIGARGPCGMWERLIDFREIFRGARFSTFATQSANSGLCTQQILPLHSSTVSERTRIVSGMVIPRAFAVLRFTTRSNLAGRSIGRSVGLVPPKIRPA